MPQPMRESLWKRGGLSWTQLGRRVWTESNNDDIWGHSAELAYYFFLALFPALFLLISVFGIVAGQNSELRGSLLQYLSRLVPASASQLINQTLDETLRAAGGTKVWLGLLGALWAASNGVAAVMNTLNSVYNQEETRPWFKRRIVVAVGLTIVVSILITAALVITLYGEGIAEFVGAQINLGSAAVLAWKIVQWPVMLLMLIVAFALVYYYGPDVRDQKWLWISPGSVIGVVLWILASVGFRFYLHFFNSYSKTYGSLGAVIILLLWFYVSGIALLMGAEVNAEIEHEAARRGAAEAKEKGEKLPEERRPAA